MLNRKIIIPLLCILFTPFGCSSTGDKESYQVPAFSKITSGEPVVPREANKIFIDPNSLRGDLTGVPEMFMTLLKNKISMDGRLAVVPDQNGADLILRYSISRYQVQVISFGNFGRPVKKRMRIIAGVQLIDAVKGRTIITDREIQSFREFSDVIPPVETEVQVLNYVLDGLADRVFAKTVTGWYTHYLTRIEKGRK